MSPLIGPTINPTELSSGRCANSTEPLSERQRQLQIFLKRKTVELRSLKQQISELTALLDEGKEKHVRRRLDRLAFIRTIRLPALEAECNDAATILATMKQER